MKRSALTIIVVSGLLFVGAGCTMDDDTTNTANNNQASVNANQNTNTSSMNTANTNSITAFETGLRLPVTDTADFTTTASGLMYKDLNGIGDEATAKAEDMVSVHYTGMLPDGTKFDSSLDRGQAFVFKLGAGSVIKGWDEGLVGMSPGQERILIIPPELGYGERGAGGTIKPGATLQFQVRLMAIQ